MSDDTVRITGELAQTVAALAIQAVGPEGTMLRVPEDDAQLLRATFIARLAEVATAIANGEVRP